MVELPEVEGDDPELDPEPEVPAPVVPGIVPQGDPLGLVPGVLLVFGFTVEGRVLLPFDGGLVELAPGTLVGGFTDPVRGAVELPVAGVDELGLWP